MVVDGGAAEGVRVRDGRCKELRMPTGKKASTRPISRPNRRAAVKTRERVDCVVMVVLGLVCGWRCWLDVVEGKRQSAEQKVVLLSWCLCDAAGFARGSSSLRGAWP